MFIRLPSLCRNRSFGLNYLNQLLKAFAFRVEPLTAQRRKAVVAAAGVVEFGSGPNTGLIDKAGLDHSLDRPVKRGWLETDFPRGALQNFLHDAVAMLFFSGEEQHDMEPLCFDRRKGLDPRLDHGYDIYYLI